MRLGPVLATLASLVAAAPGQSVSLHDLSESGAAFAFARAASPAGTTEVRLLSAAAWDVLEFEVEGAVAGQPLRLLVTNPPASFAPSATYGGFVWTPARRLAAAGAFELVPPRARFTVRLATPVPRTEAPYYTWTRFTQYIAQIQQEPAAQVTTVGTSRQGRPLYRVVIDAPSRLEKKTVLMTVRQHGNEDGSSYVLEGALDLLLARSGLQPEPQLLDRVRWVVYPLVNPDGAVANQRGNANGVDLNREWLRGGAAPSQEPEVFAIQSDVERLQARWRFAIGGDHHGWGSANHGGYRYAQAQSVSNVSGAEYREARKDTTVIERHDPSQFAWQENGGTAGMIRAELFLRFGFLLHTPEYNDTLSTAAEFHVKGQGWANAMHDTLYAPRFTDQNGRPKRFARPADLLWVTVDDDDENQNAAAAEMVMVAVRAVGTADRETLVLVETGPNTGVFRNTAPLPLVTNATAQAGNGTLEAAVGRRIVASYVDPDYPRDASQASIPVGSSDRDG